MFDYFDRRQGPFGPGRGGPVGPPFGPPPPFGPDDSRFGPPFGPGGGISGPPAGPPPAQIPRAGVRAVDPGSIRGCLFSFVYIWLDNRQQFWMWLVFVGPRSIAGWRWTGFRWVFFGTDIRRISSFACF